jgi:hypothetical protein
MKTWLCAAALGAAVVSSGAWAQYDQSGGGGRGGWMQDQTRAQAQQQADAMFQRLDVNHDGVVTRQEAEQVASQFGRGGGRAEKMIDRAFGSAQSLTQQQFEAQALARFDRDDANHDGVVTVAERQQARAMLKAQRAQGGPGQMPPAPPAGAVPPPPQPQ